METVREIFFSGSWLVVLRSLNIFRAENQYFRSERQL